MPALTISDENGKALLSTDFAKGGLGKYLKLATSFRTAVPSGALFDKPLADASGTRDIGLTLDRDLPIGDRSELTIGAGASAAVGLHGSGSEIFSGSDLQAAVTVPNGTSYVSLSLEALLRAGLSTQVGHLGFGFKAGTSIAYRWFHPVDMVATQVTVGEAIKAAFGTAVFPGDAADLRQLPVGAFVSIAGEGELSFSGSATLSTATNLLATPGLPLIGAASVTAGASVSVNAGWTISGEFELRLSRPAPETVRLSYHRRRGRSLSVSALAQAGVSAVIRDNDVFTMLMRAISPDPEADLLALVDANLDDGQVQAIQQAVIASVNRTLTLSAQFQASSLRENASLFAYDIDVSRLDAASETAVSEALDGKLDAIGAAAAAATGPIRFVAMGLGRLASDTTTWRINLLGLLNAASFAELLRRGTLTYDPASGTLTAADEITSKRISIRSRPLESDGEQLRRVLFESLMVTAAYRASRALGAGVTLSARHSYVEQRGRTREGDLEDHYRAIVALGLCDERERDTRLGDATEVGTSTFALESRFDAAACDALFLDAEGKPQPASYYETVARRALLALIPAADPRRSYRRLALASDPVWAQVRPLGGAIDTALPGHIRQDALKLAVVRGDIYTVVWWAEAMHKAAVALVEMRGFLGSRTADALAGDKSFAEARAKLENALAGVAASSQARFDDPWDVLALDAAAARAGYVEASIVSNRFAVRYTDTDALDARAEPTVSGRRSRSLATDRKADRPWTPEELEVFAGHVVNLRGGQLSGSGSFASTRDQVTRIFEEHLPRYVSTQQAAGLRPRVMFYAHGGLVEEREGLLPVLARRRFWALNGIYPIYFVWETGLFETLRDILGGAFPGGRARALVTDPAVERLARPGGKPIWGQMKKSAELASARNGGAALVADLAGALWNSAGGQVEYHALGHSAGSIFHAYFLPRLLQQQPASGVPKVSVRSLHFLAPAATTELFTQTLMPLVGAGQPISSLAMYTMTDELEQTDKSMRPYGKSLLYLVSRAFEAAVPTPIVGMQDSVRKDVSLIRFFGLAGRSQVADVVFSKSTDSASLRDRSESITHGGFDNDVPTMTSVVRRVLDVPDTEPVVDYFEEAVPGEDRAAVGPGPTAAAPRSVARPRSLVPVPSARPATRKKAWTVMVWIAGDNDLESFGADDLDEMRQVGSTDDVDVVVQFDRMSDGRTRRYHVRAGARGDADVVAELGETNTGDPAVAIDFFRWAIERYPAERLMGVIWNHGSGIDETDVYRRGVPRGVEASAARAAITGRHRRPLFRTTVEHAARERAIAYDDTARDFLDNIELKSVLATVSKQTGRVLDVLGFDACLMNMVEIAYQLKGTAHVVVGSEEIEPGAGWPYDRVLTSLAEQPAMAAGALAGHIVNHYIASYRSGSLTQSALDLSALDAMAGAVDGLAKALTSAIRTPAEYAAVTKALNATQRFEMPDYVDLGHLCREIGKRSRAAAVKAAGKSVIASLEGAGGFVLASQRKGSRVANASGVAIYFPRGPVSKTYARLDFSKATAWRRFLEAYHGA